MKIDGPFYAQLGGAAEEARRLAAIGYESLEALVDAAVPEDVRDRPPLAVPAPPPLVPAPANFTTVVDAAQLRGAIDATPPGGSDEGLSLGATPAGEVFRPQRAHACAGCGSSG